MRLLVTGLVLVLAVVDSFGRAACGVEIADLAWKESNIKTLRGFNEDACYRFFNRDDLDAAETEAPIYPDCDWYPAGNGTYELAINSQSGPDAAFLDAYWRDGQGKITDQEFEIDQDAGEGWYDGPQFADLNHDGSSDLILIAHLEYDQPSHRFKTVPDGEWPQVYRLRNGKYAEASRDFPAF